MSASLCPEEFAFGERGGPGGDSGGGGGGWRAGGGFGGGGAMPISLYSAVVYIKYGYETPGLAEHV